MTKISDRFKASLDALIQEEQASARRQGRFLDDAMQHTRVIDQSIDAVSGSHVLTAAALVPFAPVKRQLTKSWINQLYSKQKQLFNKGAFKGITAAKGLSKEDYADWLTERGLDVHACFKSCLEFPTPDQLLAYWISTGSPQLPNQ